MAFDQLDSGHILAQRLDMQLRDAHPAEIIAGAAEAFGDRLALVSSFGAESAVLLHLVSRVNPDMPVLFLDTGMLFAQTLDYRQSLARRLGLSEAMAGDARAWKQRLLRTDAREQGLSLEKLEAQGPQRSPLSPRVLFADGRVKTPSGRVNLMVEEPPNLK